MDIRQQNNIIFHPLIFAVYPILALTAANLAYLQLTDPLRILGVSLLASVLIWGAFRLLLRDWIRASLLTSLLLTLFYSFGHVITTLETLGIPETYSLHLILLVLWGVIFIAAPAFLLKSAEWQPKLSNYLNWMGLVLLLFPLFTIARQSASKIHLSQTQEEYLHELRGGAQAEGEAAPIYPNNMPDIYYIILDQYTRSDILDEYYGFDNSGFIEALEARGFYVAEESRSNYLRTHLSIPSSLSSIYMHDLPDEIYDYVLEDFSNSHTVEFLQAQGYEVATFGSGVYIFRASQPVRAVNFNDFEILLNYTTVFRIFFLQQMMADNDPESLLAGFSEQQMQTVREEINFYRTSITNAFEHIPDYAKKEGDYFIFAHIFSPHYPYVFGPNGEYIEFLPGMYDYLRDPSSPEDLSHYLDEITYLNTLVIEMVDEILANSETPPIIIIQGDHGHDSHIDYDNPDETGLYIRSAILNAYYLPVDAEADLYPSISPVNSFRVVFNHWFDTNYEVLPDESFYYVGIDSAIWQRPEFFSLCGEHNICSP
ncbi:MAG: hypothetical protein JXB38_04925 [Anaerolineales bacterium]|nr:hypothetical protein [Anaerolineales bacterium]